MLRHDQYSTVRRSERMILAPGELTVSTLLSAIMYRESSI